MVEMRAIWIITAGALLFALQVLIVCAHVQSYIPIHWKAPIPQGLEPERESLLYAIFLLSAIAAMVLGMKILRPRLKTREEQKTWEEFLAAETVWVALMVFAFFKWVTYKYPFYNILAYEQGGWVRPFFYVVLAGALASKIFWPEFRAWLSRKPWESVAQLPLSIVWGGFTVLLVLLLLPNPKSVAALSYAWDQFRNLDNTGWTRWLLKGGASYETVVVVMCALTLFFWSAVFYVLLRWLNNVWLASAAVILGIGQSLFHYGMTPVAWIYPHAFPGFPWIDPLLLKGLDNAPSFEALRVRQFFPFLMGLIWPIINVANLLIVPVSNIIRRDKIVLGILSILGLAIYTQYIAQPAVYAYGSLILPGIVIALFWANQILTRFWTKQASAVFFGLVIVASIGLFTSRLYMTYPHALWGKKYIQEEQLLDAADLTADVQLITSLTKASTRTAVVGSFELLLLKKSQRQPFFNDAPLLQSAPLDNNMVVGLRIKLKKELESAIAQINDEAPQYIFMEKKLTTLPNEFYQSNAGLASLINLIRAGYAPTIQGKYYTAWRKKND